jgi:hypothetical protein
MIAILSLDRERLAEPENSLLWTRSHGLRGTLTVSGKVADNATLGLSRLGSSHEDSTDEADMLLSGSLEFPGKTFEQD